MLAPLNRISHTEDVRQRIVTKRRAAIGVAALTAAGVALWFTAGFFAPATIDVVHPARGLAIDAVYATGTVEATVMMPIATRTTARLAELDVDEGNRVTPGQLLARLEDEDLINSQKALEATEHFARNDYARDLRLAAQGAIARQILDRARSDLQAAEANVARAAAEAHFMKLVAPASGVIIRRDGEIGELIPVNQAVFWLATDAPIRISAEVDEEDVPRVRAGEMVYVHADAFPERVFKGRVQTITAKGDAVARSYRVRIGLLEPTPLMIGMTTETNIVIHEHPRAILVPASALRNGRVWGVEEGRLVPRAIVAGARAADRVEVLSGLGVGDVVVAAPSDSLSAGQRVRARLVSWTP